MPSGCTFFDVLLALAVPRSAMVSWRALFLLKGVELLSNNSELGQSEVIFLTQNLRNLYIALVHRLLRQIVGMVAKWGCTAPSYSPDESIKKLDTSDNVWISIGKADLAR